MATHTAIPASDVLEKAAALNVFDQSGTEVTFGSLIEEQKTIVVFIRTVYFRHSAAAQYQLTTRPSTSAPAQIRTLLLRCMYLASMSRMLWH